MQDILELVWITLLPFLELRASIPYGLLAKNMNIWLVFFVCTAANIALAFLVYVFLDRFVHLFMRFRFFERAYSKYVGKAQKKIRKYVDRYGEIGVAVFIAVPLPGSGVYSGALGSYAIGLGLKKFMIASIIGVIIAGLIVTAITVLGGNGWGIFIKSI